MAFRTNRAFNWLNRALTRDEAKASSSLPSDVPSTISPVVDIFGWEALQRMRSAINSAPVGDETVRPGISADWVGALGGTVVPESVALRVMWGLHIQHNDAAAPHIMWFGLLDREGGSTGLPTETGTGTSIPEQTPLVCTRIFVLRPLETFVGRIRGLPGASTLQINYTWIDLKEGEYIPGQIR